MALNTALKLARHHLEASIRVLEEEAEGVRYNTFCIRDLASASAVLQQNDVAERACRLLRAAPDEAFWAGAIANFELPKTVPEGLRSGDRLENLEKKHPPYREEEMIGRIRSYATTEEHFALCLQGRFEEARSKAVSGIRLEEVGDTLAVLGDFDGAMSVAREPLLEPFRQRGVLLVLAIEFFRRGQFERSEVVLAELESSGLGPSERIHLALGFVGREPWGGYPYPDW